MTKENVIAPEMAEQEFERFADMMDLDIDTSVMDQEDKTSFEKIKRRVCKAIQSGALIINDDGEAVYSAQNPKTKHKDPITFHERTGTALMEMDNKKKGQDIAKTYAVMAGMCKVHPSVFTGMVGGDGKVCEAIFALLMD